MILFAAGAIVAVAAATAHPAGPAVVTPAGSVPLPVVVVEAPASPSTAFGPPDSLAPPPPPRPPMPDVLPFGPGERLRFSVDFGIINAGWALMEVGDSRRYVGSEILDIRTEANSNAFFSKIHKVRDRARTFFDPELLLPRRFEKHQREGGYEKDLLIKFDRDLHLALYENGDEVVIDPWAQDELSAFYYLRLLPLAVGRDVLIDNHTNRKNYPLKVIVHGRETVTVGAGTFDCWVIEPVVREGGIFEAKGTLTIWLTADARRIPVKMRTKILVGSITVTLVDYQLGEPWRRSGTADAGSG